MSLNSSNFLGNMQQQDELGLLKLLNQSRQPYQKNNFLNGSADEEDDELSMLLKSLAGIPSRNSNNGDKFSNVLSGAAKGGLSGFFAGGTKGALAGGIKGLVGGLL